MLSNDYRYVWFYDVSWPSKTSKQKYLDCHQTKDRMELIEKSISRLMAQVENIDYGIMGHFSSEMEIWYLGKSIESSFRNQKKGSIIYSIQTQIKYEILYRR